MYKEEKPRENVLSCSAALFLLAAKHNCLTSSTPAYSQGRVLLLHSHQNDFVIECLVIHLTDFDVLLGITVINLWGTKVFYTASPLLTWYFPLQQHSKQINKMMS